MKVVLSWLRRRGHPEYDAAPNFFPDSKSYVRVSNEVLNLTLLQVEEEKLSEIRGSFVERADIFWLQCRLLSLETLTQKELEGYSIPKLS